MGLRALRGAFVFVEHFRRGVETRKWNGGLVVHQASWNFWTFRIRSELCDMDYLGGRRRGCLVDHKVGGERVELGWRDVGHGDELSRFDGTFGESGDFWCQRATKDGRLWDGRVKVKERRGEVGKGGEKEDQKGRVNFREFETISETSKPLTGPLVLEPHTNLPRCHGEVGPEPSQKVFLWSFAKTKDQRETHLLGLCQLRSRFRFTTLCPVNQGPSRPVTHSSFIVIFIIIFRVTRRVCEVVIVGRGMTAWNVDISV